MIELLSPVKSRSFDWGQTYDFELSCMRLYVPDWAEFRMHGDKSTYYGMFIDDADISVEANGHAFLKLDTLIDSKAAFRVKIITKPGSVCFVGKIKSVARSVVVDFLQRQGLNDIGFISPSNTVLGSYIIGRTVKDCLTVDKVNRSEGIIELEKTMPSLFCIR